MKLPKNSTTGLAFAAREVTNPPSLKAPIATSNLTPVAGLHLKTAIIP